MIVLKTRSKVKNAGFSADGITFAKVTKHEKQIHI
jgi:hypothetical protein